MAARLLFPDPETAADALTFAARASSLTEDAVRLRAKDGILVMTAAALSPRGLGDPTPTVLGLRILRIDPELVCDLVVASAALAPASGDSRAVLLPDTSVSAAWAGISPPRGGWIEDGVVDHSALRRRGEEGMRQVAAALPASPGADVVRTVRAAIWVEPAPELAGLPAGAAFAALTLGFVTGPGRARLLRSGPWARIETPAGHVLVRGPQAVGMTAIRTTGAAR